MEISEAQEFLKNNHRGCLVTRKKDGSLQMTLVSPVLGADGNVIITARDTTYKVKNIQRNPQISLLVYGEKFNGSNYIRSTARPKLSPSPSHGYRSGLASERFAVNLKVGKKSRKTLAEGRIAIRAHDRKSRPAAEEIGLLAVAAD